MPHGETQELALDIFDQFPSGLESCEIQDIREYFPNSALVDIKGQNEDYLFVSVLLHGNELTSFEVLKRLAKEFSQSTPKKGLLIFVGNVFAAVQGQRHLSHQPDYNRIWEDGTTPEHRLVEKVGDYVASKKLFASIDIHNNTGANPFYSCITDLSPEFLILAELFSNQIVHFKTPKNVQCRYFEKFCPSITIECGLSENIEGANKSFQLVKDVLEIESLDHKVVPTDLSVYRTVARIHIIGSKDEVEMAFQNLDFNMNIEKANFTALEEGKVFASYNGDTLPIQVLDEQNHDQTSKYFELKDGKILLKHGFIPSMLTRNIAVISQDCFGYIMQEISI